MVPIIIHNISIKYILRNILYIFKIIIIITSEKIKNPENMLKNYKNIYIYKDF